MPFSLLTLFLDRHVMVPEIKFWTQVSSTNWKKGKKKSVSVDDVYKCLQVFFMLFRGKDNHFQEKQKSPYTRMALDGSYVKTQ